MLDYKIKTFLTLCEKMNYTVTAEVVHLTQPAVTAHIQLLEEEYGCKLFTYENRVLKKTKQAEILERYAQSVIFNEKKLLEDLQPNGKTLIRIGATKTIGNYILTDKIKKLAQNGDFEIYFFVENTKNLLRMLKSSALDFVFLEGFFNKIDYDYKFFQTGELVGICAPEHVFANKSINVEDIFSQHVIIREKGSGTREIFERVLQENNFSFKNIVHKTTINSFYHIIDLVKNNIGISFVFKQIFDTCDNLATFSINNIHITHEFNCVFLKNTCNNLEHIAEKFF